MHFTTGISCGPTSVATCFHPAEWLPGGAWRLHEHTHTHTHGAAYTEHGLSGAPPLVREAAASRSAHCRRCSPNPPPLRLRLHLELSRRTANRLDCFGGGAVNRSSPAENPKRASAVLSLGDQILTPNLSEYPYLADRALQHVVGHLGQIENESRQRSHLSRVPADLLDIFVANC